MTKIKQIVEGSFIDTMLGKLIKLAYKKELDNMYSSVEATQDIDPKEKAALEKGKKLAKDLENSIDNIKNNIKSNPDLYKRLKEKGFDIDKIKI